ncbi:MAG: PEGA domain-containing protein [Clostridia bacterium]|nr:PEGA domain-containing protein [Deltaproteobacteria bacterium]
MHIRLVALLFLSLASFMGRGAQAADGTPAKVVVLDLTGLGLHGANADLPKALGTYLRNSIATMDGFQLLPPVDVQIAVQQAANKRLIDCTGGSKCSAEIGKLVAADRVIFGTIGAVSNAYSLNARVVDVATGREAAKYQATFAGSRDALIPEIRLAAYKLLAPDRIRGSLSVQTDVEGAVVEVDGTARGTTPMNEPVRYLTPGKHVIAIKRPGYATFTQDLQIRAFETAKLQLRLSAKAE